MILDQEIGPLCGFPIAIYVSIAVIVLLNLVTGVCVDGAIKIGKRDQAAMLSDAIRQGLSMCDDTGEGVITVEQLTKGVADRRMASLFERMHLTTESIPDV